MKEEETKEYLVTYIECLNGLGGIEEQKILTRKELDSMLAYRDDIKVISAKQT